METGTRGTSGIFDTARVTQQRDLLTQSCKTFLVIFTRSSTWRGWRNSMENFPSVSIFPSSPPPLSFLLFCQYTLALWSDEKGFCNLVCDSTKPGKLWPGGIALTLFSELFFMHHGGLSAWLVTVSFWWGFRSCCVQWMLGFLRISRN